MQMPLLVAEKFLGPSFVDKNDEESFEDVSIELEVLRNIEMEKERFVNLRPTLHSHVEMLQFLIDHNTEVFYPPVTRTRFEVRNGYKEAVKRGANLQEAEVFNLLFTFKGRFRGDGIALMCHGPKGQEWIMLCPDDTMARIRYESRKYLDAAYDLVFQNRMDSDFQSVLLENLQTLNPGTRCANSLEHEYGHILQHRIWAAEGFVPSNVEKLFDWFDTIGYVDNVAMRLPKFLEKSEEDILQLLKEAFVEDYRIGLNMASQKGQYELPNAFCFWGDFIDPGLMHQGVNIVKNTLQNKNITAKVSYQHVSSEPDRIVLIDEIMQAGKDFDPKSSRMTPADHHALRERMKAYSRKSHT